MCVQCDVLQKKIENYRSYTKQSFDQLTIVRIKALIEDLERQLLAMH